MPYLDNIITQLNSLIIKSSLSFLNEGNINAFGIVETMIDVQEGIDEQGRAYTKTIRYPAIIDNDGEAKMIEVDDSYSIIFYHRLESIVNAIAAPKNTYGGVAEMTESVNMALIVIAFRDQIRKPVYWLEGALKNNFADKINITNNADEILLRSSLKVGNSNFDKLSLLQREYSEVELNFPHLMIFELKYRIDSQFKKGCFDNCTDC